MTVIDWTPELIKKLRGYVEYADTLGASSEDSFRIEGEIMLVGYAKYLLEYLDTRRGDNNG